MDLQFCNAQRRPLEVETIDIDKGTRRDPVVSKSCYRRCLILCVIHHIIYTKDTGLYRLRMISPVAKFTRSLLSVEIDTFRVLIKIWKATGIQPIFSH